MTEQDAARILLVRSIEEVDKEAFSTARLSEALSVAGKDMRPAVWFDARAAYLLETVPNVYHSIIRMAQLPQGWTVAIAAIAFVVGLGSNYLGDFEKIPLLLNPLMALVAWNLIVYGASALISLRSRGRKPAASSAQVHPTVTAPVGTPAIESPSDRPPGASWIVRVLLASVWIALHKLTLRFHASRKQANSFVRVARRFWHHWSKAAPALLAARWRGALHVSALCLAAGAVAGMYIRGIFLRYEVIWTSTFVTDQNTVSRLIEIIFGPALFISRVAGRDLTSQIDIARLMSPAGAPAAPWIHLFALTALLIVVVPRAALATAQWFYIQRVKHTIQINFDEYFANLIRPQIGTMIAEEMARGVQEFAQTMARFVCTELYDGRIVPALQEFRARGGKIRDLRVRIQESCEASRDKIGAWAETAAQQWEASAAAAVERILRTVRYDFRFPAVPLKTAGDLEILRDENFTTTLRPIGHGLTDVVSLAISASFAIALGTLAGGFGESLEIAILVGLFGTTGPVGFLIGAIAGLIVAGGAWWYGREKIAGKLEEVTLPASVVRMVLWQSRFDGLIRQGRAKCGEMIESRVREVLSPLTPQIAEQVWLRLQELWTEKSDQPAQSIERGV
jgi:hypothetical protein